MKLVSRNRRYGEKNVYYGYGYFTISVRLEFFDLKSSTLFAHVDPNDMADDEKMLKTKTNGAKYAF